MTELGRLTLHPGQWYAFQTFAGGFGPPFDATPILITDVEPLKTGKRLLRLRFVRLVAPLRAALECQTVQIRHRAANLLVVGQVDAHGEGNLILAPLTFNWLKQVQPQVSKRFDPSWDFGNDDGQIHDYMTAHFGGDTAAVMTGVTAEAYQSDLPLPAAGTLSRIGFKRRFEGIEAWLLLRGLKPRSSDDRWFIHVDWEGSLSGMISFRRSWTLQLFWQLPFRVETRTVCIDRANVNLDAQRAISGREDEAELDFTVRTLLLGQQCFAYSRQSSG